MFVLSHFRFSIRSSLRARAKVLLGGLSASSVLRFNVTNGPRIFRCVRARVLAVSLKRVVFGRFVRSICIYLDETPMLAAEF